MQHFACPGFAGSRLCPRDFRRLRTIKGGDTADLETRRSTRQNGLKRFKLAMQNERPRQRNRKCNSEQNLKACKEVELRLNRSQTPLDFYETWLDRIRGRHGRSRADKPG